VIDAGVPVAVIYHGGYGAVAVARTLGRLGVPMYLIAQEGTSTPVWFSRHWQKKTRWDFSRPEEETLAFLRDYGAKLQSKYGARAILLTLADWVATFIEQNSKHLQEHFLFPQSERPVIHDLLNKWEMHRLAAEHGIPTSPTVLPSSRDDVEEFVETAGFPIVMKAADPYLPDPPSKKIVDSRQELLDEVDRQAARGPLNTVLQAYIPGDADSVWMCNGYFGSDPERDVVFTGKKLRQVSATGIASLAICLPNETVEDQTRQLMNGVGYRGCVGIGYRFDRRDGLYKLLDVNARVSGVFRLFAGTNDMDVVRVCYLDLTGQDVPETALQPGRKWMLEDDILAALRDVKDGRLSISDWMRSVRGVRERHWFAADDPGPLFAWLGDGSRRGALATFKRLRKADRERAA
jgi:D-aspartate ligase